MAANMRDPVIQALVAARVHLLFNDPFYGNLATRMELVRDNDQPSMVIHDRRRLHYNDAYVTSLTPDELHEAISDLIDQMIADLDRAQKPGIEEETWRETIAAIMNANSAINRNPTDRIGHIVRLASPEDDEQG